MFRCFACLFVIKGYICDILMVASDNYVYDGPLGRPGRQQLRPIRLLMFTANSSSSRGSTSGPLLAVSHSPFSSPPCSARCWACVRRSAVPISSSASLRVQWRCLCLSAARITLETFCLSAEISPHGAETLILYSNH